MVNIKLFDGTRDSKYYRVAMKALQELSDYVPVAVSPKSSEMPNGIHLHSYNLTQELVTRSTNGQRVNTAELENVGGESVSATTTVGANFLPTYLPLIFKGN